MRYMTRVFGAVAVLAAMVVVAGCGKRMALEGPDATVALVAAYGADVLRTAEGAVDVVITYTKTTNEGYRTAETDAVVAAIEDQLVPSAARLSSLLNQYVSLSNLSLKNLKADEIETQLQGIETLVEVILKQDVPDELASSLSLTVARTHALVAAIRAELDKFRA